ncbi:MAG: hypothetical protein WAS23_02020, partial [Dokdonella sp.]
MVQAGIRRIGAASRQAGTRLISTQGGGGLGYEDTFRLAGRGSRLTLAEQPEMLAGDHRAAWPDDAPDCPRCRIPLIYAQGLFARCRDRCRAALDP